jgi:restriction system protein
VRAQLLAALKELDPYVFEDVIGRLLGRLGYEDAVVTRKSSDKGIDVTATLRLEGVTEVPTVIQAKRFTTRNVDGGVVRELRGALTSGQHGVIITTSGFTKDAVTEATAMGKAPIALVDGHGLVDLLMKKGLGVQTRLVPLFTLDLDDLLAESAKDK